MSNFPTLRTPYIYKYENPTLFYAPLEKVDTSVGNLNIDGFYSNLSVGIENENSYSIWQGNSGQVLSAAVLGDYIYLASGSDGIVVLNKSDNSVAYVYPPKRVGGRIGFASSIEIKNNKLYCAEDIAGLGVYNINTDGSLVEISELRYQNSAHIISQVRLSPNCSYAVVHIGGNQFGVIPIDYTSNTIGEIAVTELKSGNMYHRNLSEVIDGRYIIVWNHVGNMCWIDFNPQGNIDSAPTYKMTQDNAMATMTGGIAAYEDGALFEAKGGYRIYSDIGVFTEYKENGASFYGKPTVCGDYLVVTSHDNGMIYVIDISDIRTPRLVHKIDTVGNPDVAYYDSVNGSVYIPLGNQGLLVINLNSAFDKEVTEN